MAECIFEVIPPLTWVEIQIVLDADWNDNLPVIWEGDAPLDLTGGILDLTVRPTYDHSVRLALLTSGFSGGGIVIDDAAAGLAHIFWPRANVNGALPAGRWQHFLTLTQGGQVREIWRGPLSVHPGNFGASGTTMLGGVTADTYGVRVAGRAQQGAFRQAA